MILHIEPVRKSEGIHELLCSHGWRLEQLSGTTYSAQHPAVTDQASARQKLHALGLLTSPAVRIDIQHHTD
jgi:hypothetical protein